MTQEHPITPPPELLEKWEAEVAHTTKDEIWHVAVQAARWGADQELEACKEWVSWRHSRHESDELLFARRPQPPSLKELALKALNEAVYMAEDIPPEGISTDQADTIRRALEQLDD